MKVVFYADVLVQRDQLLSTLETLEEILYQSGREDVEILGTYTLAYGAERFVTPFQRFSIKSTFLSSFFQEAETPWEKILSPNLVSLVPKAFESFAPNPEVDLVIGVSAGIAGVWDFSQTFPRARGVFVLLEDCWTPYFKAPLSFKDRILRGLTQSLIEKKLATGSFHNPQVTWVRPYGEHLQSVPYALESRPWGFKSWEFPLRGEMPEDLRRGLNLPEKPWVFLWGGESLLRKMPEEVLKERVDFLTEGFPELSFLWLGPGAKPAYLEKVMDWSDRCEGDLSWALAQSQGLLFLGLGVNFELLFSALSSGCPVFSPFIDSESVLLAPHVVYQYKDFQKEFPTFLQEKDCFFPKTLHEFAQKMSWKVIQGEYQRIFFKAENQDVQGFIS